MIRLRLGCRLETSPVELILQIGRSIAEYATNRWKVTRKNDLNQDVPSNNKKQLGTIVDTITLKQRGSSDGEEKTMQPAALDDGSDNNKVPSKPPAMSSSTTPFGRSQV